MSGRGRGGPPGGGGRGGYVYNSATRLPEDRDVQEGRQSHSKAAAVGLPPRLGTYDDRPRGRGRGRGAGGPPSSGRARVGGGGGPPPPRQRDSGYPRADTYRPGRPADTYRPVEETYPHSNLPSRPPPPHMSSAPRWRTEPEAGPSTTSAYNPPSPHHTRYDRSAPSRQAQPLPVEGDYSPPSPVQQHYDELQDDIKPVVSRPPTPPLPQPAPLSRPVPPAPAARPKPTAPPDPVKEALKKMQRFKPGPSNRAKWLVAATPPAAVASTFFSAGKNTDVKPTRQQLEEPVSNDISRDDPDRPSGVLALSYAKLPPDVRSHKASVKKAAREKVVHEQTALLAKQGRKPVRGGVRWRDDGCSIDWEKTAIEAEEIALVTPAPTSQPHAKSNEGKAVATPSAPRAGFGVDPGPSMPGKSPKKTKKEKKTRERGFTSPDDRYPGRPESIPTEKWNSLSKGNRKSVRIRDELNKKRASDPSLEPLTRRQLAKVVKKSKRERSPDDSSIVFSSGASASPSPSPSSSSASSTDQPLAKRHKTSSMPAEAKPSLTPSIRNAVFPTPTPSDPDLAALAKIAELETTLENKITDVDRWTKMKKDYPHLEKKTQLQIEELQDEIARLFDEIGRLKGRE